MIGREKLNKEQSSLSIHKKRKNMMANMMTRVVTFNSGDRFVSKDAVNTKWTGICVELWEQIASDLNLTYNVMEVQSYMDIFADQSDVIMQRTDEGLLASLNMTK